MKNIQAVWPPSPEAQKVTSYKVFYSRVGEAPVFLSETVQPIMIIYPDQLGFVDNDTIEVSVSAVNGTGEGPHENSVEIWLNEQVPPLPLPTEVIGLVLTLV